VPGLSAYGLKTISIRWKRGCATLGNLRRLGDKHTWTIPLDTAGIFCVETPSFILESATFKLQTCHGNPATYYRVSAYCTLSSPISKYKLVTGANQNHQFLEEVGPYTTEPLELKDQVHDSTVIEILKMPQEQHPQGFQDVCSGRMQAREMHGKFALPNNWTFYDQEVVECLEKV
jgi:hypothetical protein